MEETLQDFYSYSASINACACCQHWQHALALASVLADHRMPPNGIMWGAIVSAMPSKARPTLSFVSVAGWGNDTMMYRMSF